MGGDDPAIRSKETPRRSPAIRPYVVTQNPANGKSHKREVADSRALGDVSASTFRTVIHTGGTY
jgi:hypothetical protein